MSNGSDQSQLTASQKIIAWATGKLGKQVGSGQCWDLGEQALKNAGAQTSNDLAGHRVGKNDNYIWGDPIEDLKDVQPGDILQLRNHFVTTTTVTKYTFEDGSTVTENSERIARRGHHTAIVNSMPDANGVLKTYEQHVNGRDVVQAMTLYTRDIDETTTKSTGKQKHKHPKTKTLEPARITKTVTIKVTGKIWAYRPKTK